MTATQADARTALRREVESAAKTVSSALKVLDRYGHADAAEAIRRTWADTTLRGTVVVVGEVKRGKSSVINAIAGARDLLPVDVDVCTSVPVQVLRSDENTEVIDLNFGDYVERAPLSELREWTTMNGARVSDPDTPELPTGVTVRVAGDHVPRALFIDTPGAGGLDREAIDIALERARGAGVLLMVCDATTPITAPEMDILARAAQAAGSVVVAVTKTDKNLRRWRAIVDDDRRLIREHLGRDVPVIGVSSLRAVDAAEMADPDRRARVEKTSGVAELRAHIAAEMARGALLSKVAALSMAESALEGVAASIDADIAAVDRAEEVVPELEARREELRRLRDHGQEWEQILSRNISVARQSIMANFDAEMDRIREHWIRTINNSGMKVLRSKPQVFTSRIEEELSAAAESTVNRQLEVLRREANALFGDDHEWEAMAGAALLSIAPGGAGDGRHSVASKTENLLDPSMLTLGIISGPAIASAGGGALAAMGLATIALPAAVIGGGWLGVNMAYRAMRNGKQHLVTWTRETVAALRMSVNRNIDTLVTTVRTEIVLRYRARLRREGDELKRRIEDARATARASEEERRQTLARLNRNKEIVAKVRADLATSAGTLRGVGR
ncbi:dynamin family protein [Corynebacterium freneyi]|uniref:GTP-binding protein EngB required for normal cell division n=1 Tax=Corynebacterium freneyi TaxID=134034 RepID=A0ABS4U5W8_9CORY|nr:dynamin family protein [Corynebacterium freneyi]MBP2331571.1 GTP-binding protein EngB required for normal cell division [Corynebacterium freneyi]MCG7439422.1 dynamin family protein [Corynebacterium freneyi]QXA51964.1 dynamin family protein [Corynebacterium freneyi]